MLRTLTSGARRKFSFDLASHRSREKNDDDTTGIKNQKASRRTPQVRRRKISEQASPRTPPQRAASSNQILGEESDLPEALDKSVAESKDHAPSIPKTYLGPVVAANAETNTDEKNAQETRQSWLRMKEARKHAAQSPRKFRPSKESAERGRTSARGDDAPRIRELSRDRFAEAVRKNNEQAVVTIRTRNLTTRKTPPLEDKPSTPPRPPPSLAPSSKSSAVDEDSFLDRTKNTPPQQDEDILNKHLRQTPSRESREKSDVEKDQGVASSLSLPLPAPPENEKKKSSREEKKPPRKPLVLQEPPSWQQLKTKAMEADFASMVDFIEHFGSRRHEIRTSRNADQTNAFAFNRSYNPSEQSSRRENEVLHEKMTGDAAPNIKSLSSKRAQSATRTTGGAEIGGEHTFKSSREDGPTFDKWFTDRFPENNLSSAPSAHKALWAEYDRQARYKRLESRRSSREIDDPNSSYLDRLRGIKQNPTKIRHSETIPPSIPTNRIVTYKSGSIASPGRILVSSTEKEAPYDSNGTYSSQNGQKVRTTLHTVTWKVERWSALPSGFRQGARYRPPGGAPWSLDLYKGGIKRERPGMIALYVHYDAPNSNSSATVTSLELSLMNQTTGAHLMRKHEGTRIFGSKADPKRRISTSAGTASLAHLCLTQVEKLGFCVNDTVVLRAEIEVLVPESTPSSG
uniref:MATH domain-containing protein n=1 Tax=Aureoumbra lagunensis TaxID=44058 RepID=A0A7S3NL30_9STRA|mmetsp:Transcript_18478/g.22685  ORF Transcript_18478/g.22685 Transcript_18478/m.22685 type:complete len:686 (+) Transcript_18478:82-2139(+)|eukprot:CAMPEP_0197307096 /NCGR_PEP_ID=MMETSP0891-20130614/4508_1 /TAXON_ID=44058 ORGANISM="Aureoumbra lagunensis, Strain CCMP1510" /NCGR_SAMPLE_ID=MMETSP0891 /ASSEMBLY_ACC=CAM_ASM_000534 /LENGTH=685 /DNA_ID=CAMNT_0042790081 /DNA_START=50 /DNA_END=2110 /DNA_ORIENTATION=+